MGRAADGDGPQHRRNLRHLHLHLPDDDLASPTRLRRATHCDRRYRHRFVAGGGAVVQNIQNGTPTKQPPLPVPPALAVPAVLQPGVEHVSDRLILHRRDVTTAVSSKSLLNGTNASQLNHLALLNSSISAGDRIIERPWYTRSGIERPFPWLPCGLAAGAVPGVIAAPILATSRSAASAESTPETYDPPRVGVDTRRIASSEDLGLDIADLLRPGARIRPITMCSAAEKEGRRELG
jgi:hypothetical protein